MGRRDRAWFWPVRARHTMQVLSAQSFSDCARTGQWEFRLARASGRGRWGNEFCGGEKRRLNTHHATRASKTRYGIEPWPSWRILFSTKSDSFPDVGVSVSGETHFSKQNR